MTVMVIVMDVVTYTTSGKKYSTAFLKNPVTRSHHDPPLPLQSSRLCKISPSPDLPIQIFSTSCDGVDGGDGDGDGDGESQG